jgi:hypothetical protein
VLPWSGGFDPRPDQPRFQWPRGRRAKLVQFTSVCPRNELQLSRLHCKRIALWARNQNAKPPNTLQNASSRFVRAFRASERFGLLVGRGACDGILPLRLSSVPTAGRHLRAAQRVSAVYTPIFHSFNRLSKFFAGGRRDVDETGAVGPSQFNRIVRASEFIRLVAESPPSVPLLASE